MLHNIYNTPSYNTIDIITNSTLYTTYNNIALKLVPTFMIYDS